MDLYTDFIEKIGDTITAKGREAADKAKDMANIANLKAQVSTCEDIVKKNYLEIGKLYYDNFGDAPDALFEKQCRNIKNAKHGAEEINKKINEIKGI